MTLARVLAEARRELQRTPRVWLLGLLFLPALLLGLLEPEEGVHTLFELTYLFMPVFLLPLGVGLATRDRRHGLARLQATTPVTPGEMLTGKAVSLAALATGVVLATLPLYLAALSPLPTIALLQATPHLGWAILLGTGAGAAGLLLGFLLPGHPRLALSGSFLMVITWFVVGINRAQVIAAPDAPTRWVALLLVNTDPFAWAAQAVHGKAGGGILFEGSHALALGLVALTGLWLLVCTILVGSLQHAEGWHGLRPARWRPLISLLALVLVSGGTLAAWTPLEPAPREHDIGQPQERVVEELWVEFGLWKEGPGLGGWTQRQTMELALAVVGPPNATVILEEVVLQHPHLTIEGLEAATPTTLRLSKVVNSPPPDSPFGPGSYGVNTTRLPVVVETHRALERYPRLDLQLRFDRFDIEAEVPLLVEWDIPVTATLATTGAALVAVAGCARWLPRRWNRW